MRRLLIVTTYFVLVNGQLERMSSSRSSDRDTEVTENDKIACRELRQEYTRACVQATDRRGEDEFCRAFENVCIRLASSVRSYSTESPSLQESSNNDLDSPERSPSLSVHSSSSSSSSRKGPDFTEFCRRFKNRYLYVCPNPFRFGQKAVVFCPIYSERCDIPLPEKPVVPQRKTSHNFAVDRLCASYASFANSYCRNPIFLAQQQYRTSCEKYWRFCTPR